MRMIRGIYMIVGLLALVLGIIGIVLPVLPTTPFLLLAAYGFARGSERFDRWFRGTSVYDKYVASFLKHRAMTLRQKAVLMVFSDVMLLLAFIQTGSLLVRLLLVCIVVYKYYFFIVRIRTVPGAQTGGQYEH